MSDDSDEPKGLSPLAIIALVAVSVPMVFSMASSSSRTVNGQVVEASYFDPVAVFAGAVGVLFAILLGAIGRGGRLGRWMMALILMAVGARHVMHGLGMELIPGLGTPHPVVASNGTGFGASGAPSCDEDHPEPCQELCDKGDADACDELGVAIVNGEGSLSPDDAKAEALFAKSCELKDPQGCKNIAVFFFQGRTTKTDGAKALEYAKQGCTLKNAFACNAAGAILADGKGVEGDFVAALPFFEQACTGEFGAGCQNVGNAYRDAHGVEQNFATAEEWYAKGCELKDPGACNEQGVLLNDEDRTDEAREKAGKLWARACELKSAHGCSNLGHRLLKTDPAAAVDPLDDACNGGRTRACESLGLLLYTGGEGVPKNLTEARRVFARGCEEGHVNSCVNEGIMQMEGEGGPVDLDEAVENLRTACDAKDEKGCARLGLALAPSDPAAAKPLLTTACKEHKFQLACDELKKLGKDSGSGAAKKKGKKK
ncbi:MAG: tetratricopeptide repeat protein [Archangium sp.]